MRTATESPRRPSPGLPSRPPVRLLLVELEGKALPSVTSVFQMTNLVSDQTGVAQFQDTRLKNAEGISLSPVGGAFWVSANGTGVSPLYTGDVTGASGTPSAIGQPFVVSLPGGVPTGQVFNGSSDFTVTAGGVTKPSAFIFAESSGFITAWNPNVPPTTPPPSKIAEVSADTKGVADFTGLAINNAAGGSLLYAADFRNGVIDVFDKNFQPTTLAGNFTDPNLPKGFLPFNIQNLGGKLYVTYARADGDGDGGHDGHSGVVDVFDLNGKFLQRLDTRAHLDQPWGLALAPANFGTFAGALLVGNHGDGTISAFDPSTGQFLGQLTDTSGAPIHIDGLWGLAFGNGRTAGDSNALYFAAGPDNGAHGLFGSLRVAGTKISGEGMDGRDQKPDGGSSADSSGDHKSDRSGKGDGDHGVFMNQGGASTNSSKSGGSAHDDDDMSLFGGVLVS